MLRRALGPWLLVALAAGLGRATEPGDTALIRIAARSALSLGEVARAPALRAGLIAVRLRAQLIDSAQRSGAPSIDGPSRAALADQDLHLALRPAPRGVAADAIRRTDSAGAAEWTLTLPAGSYRVMARFPGDELRDAAVAELALALDRLPTRLSIGTDERVPLGGELSARIDLRGPAGEEGLWEPLAGVVTLRYAGQSQALRIDRGQAVLRQPLPRGLRGGQDLLLEARYAGDAVHGPAQAEQHIQITTRIVVTLDPPGRPGVDASGAPLRAIELGQDLLISGRALDEEGPLAGAPFAISADGAQLGAGFTDDFGRLRLRVPLLAGRGGPLAVGTTLLRARVDSRRSFRQPGTSAEVALTVLPVPPRGLRWYLIPILLTALGSLGSLAWRRRQALWRWLRALGALGLGVRAAVAPPPRLPMPEGQGGVRLSQVGRLRALLPSARVPDHGVSGVIEDAVFAQPLADAEIVASAEGVAAQATRSDGAGRFELRGPLPPRATLVISARGYLPVQFPAVLPHHGELRGMRVALAPIRIELLRRFRALVQAEAASPERTPREVVAGLSDAGLAARLVPLLPLLEEGLFSAEILTPEALREADRLSGGSVS